MELEANKEKGDETTGTHNRTNQADLNGDMRTESIKEYANESMYYTSKPTVDDGTEIESMNKVDRLLNRLGVLSELADEGNKDLKTALKNTVEELQMSDAFTEEQCRVLRNHIDQL